MIQYARAAAARATTALSSPPPERRAAALAAALAAPPSPPPHSPRRPRRPRRRPRREPRSMSTDSARNWQAIPIDPLLHIWSQVLRNCEDAGDGAYGGCIDHKVLCRHLPPTAFPSPVALMSSCQSSRSPRSFLSSVRFWTGAAAASMEMVVRQRVGVGWM